MKNSLVIKRIKAFVIDYAIILIYIGLLFGVTLLVFRIFQLVPADVHPVAGQLIGFATLTAPVILYFILSEKSKHAGTAGKRKLGLRVVNTHLTRATVAQLLVRNCIKFLPWELAHFFVYRLFYFTSIKQDTPGWVMTGLIVSQGLAIIYLLFIFFTKGNRSVYELFSNTRVIAE
ncbi:MAG: RDD family protein [Bacteroidota bacterium]